MLLTLVSIPEKREIPFAGKDAEEMASKARLVSIPEKREIPFEGAVSAANNNSVSGCFNP